STDYQPRTSLRRLVQDGYAILKVGPALTFAMREALYGLDLIAGEVDMSYPRRALADAMESAMLTASSHWRQFYPGHMAEQRILRRYSYSDRIRYYWRAPQAEAAVARLLASLADRRIPETLISQFLPRLVAGGSAATGDDTRSAAQLVAAAIDLVLADYDDA